MRAALAVLLLVAALVGLLYVSIAGAEEGNGVNEVSRLPWKDGTSRTLTQGWFGCDPSHCDPNFPTSLTQVDIDNYHDGYHADAVAS